MRIIKEEKVFKELFGRVLDKRNDDDKDPKPSPPVRVTELLVDKEREEKEPPAIVDDHQKVMKKSSSSSSEEIDHKPPAARVVNHHYQRRTTEFKEPVGKLMLPAKKRPFLEYNQQEEEEEEEEATHNNKKKIENEICCCTANPPPELPRKFTYCKNRAWGSSFTRYFVKENNVVEEKPKKKSNNKRIRTRDSPPNQPPPLPHKYREKVNAMGGSEPVLVIQKQLFKSDMTQQHNRLSMPIRQIEAKFLTESLTDEEKGHLKKKELEVTLIDPRLVEWTLNMREWNMNSSVYVLITNWYKLVEENDDLKAGTEVQLWSFRMGKKLCFVLVRLNS